VRYWTLDFKRASGWKSSRATQCIFVLWFDECSRYSTVPELNFGALDLSNCKYFSLVFITGVFVPFRSALDSVDLCNPTYSVIKKNMDSISYVYISWNTYDMWIIYIKFERWGLRFSNTTAIALLCKIFCPQKILCCTVAILLSTDATSRMCARREL
jgi:hypothetical protein